MNHRDKTRYTGRSASVVNDTNSIASINATTSYGIDGNMSALIATE